MRRALVLLVPFCACGPGAMMMTQPMERDVRVAVPATDPAYLDFVTSEAVIEPSSERMICTDLVYDGEDVAYRDFEALQGKFAHHLVLLASKNPKAPGTVYDCTDVRSMKDFDPFAFPAGGDLPAGYASFLPHGKAMTIQMHYINTSTQPIRVRDVIRMKKVAMAEVTTWSSIYVFNGADFSIAPNAQAASWSFDCTLDKDVELLVLGGHMHGLGSTFKIEYGPSTSALSPIYSVDVWKPEFRDSPPTNLYLTQPKAVAKGTVFRTTCSWNNTTDHALSFPEEMCVTFGFVAGVKEPWSCQVLPK